VGLGLVSALVLRRGTICEGGGVEFHVFGKVRRAWDWTLEGKFGDFLDGIDISFEFVAIDKSLKLQRTLRIVPCGR
jgi:hypothetical protein